MASHRTPILLICLIPACFSNAQNVTYAGRKVAGRWFHAVIANLNSDNVKVTGVVNNRLGRSESFWRMIAGARPTAAISGTFFDVKRAFPVGSIIIEGAHVVEGLRGSCLAVDYFNQASILDPKYGERFYTDTYRFLVRGGVRIMHRGKLSIYPRAQRFRDPRVWSKARRIAVGVTDSNKLIFLATNGPVYLRDLVGAMKLFGARDAIALDGGGSSAFYYRGRLLVRPKRKLTNLIALYEGPGAAWTPPVETR